SSADREMITHIPLGAQTVQPGSLGAATCAAGSGPLPLRRPAMLLDAAGAAARRRNQRSARAPAQRGRRAETCGHVSYGEARLIDAMAPRGAGILDAGCGSGRLGGYLARGGQHVTGVDLDPHLIEVAREDHPEAHWYVGDLAQLDLRDQHVPAPAPDSPV